MIKSATWLWMNISAIASLYLAIITSELMLYSMISMFAAMIVLYIMEIMK